LLLCIIIVIMNVGFLIRIWNCLCFASTCAHPGILVV